MRLLLCTQRLYLDVIMWIILQVQDALQHLSQFYGAKEKHLPSSLVQIGGATDWIAGPKILVSDITTIICLLIFVAQQRLIRTEFVYCRIQNSMSVPANGMILTQKPTETTHMPSFYFPGKLTMPFTR